MNFKEMVEAMPHVRVSQLPGELNVERLTYSSRDAGPGAAFFALKGHTVDGHDYIPQALEAGASCVIAESVAPEECQVPWVQVRDCRESMAEAAAAIQGWPSREMPVAGVTGTNGKTTITFLLHYLIKRARYRCGMLGTVHYDLGDEIAPATHTTPESVEIQSLLARMASVDCRGAVMEVSSHALSQHRVDSVEFDAAIFTNLTQDHLDFHGSMDAYFEAKALLGELLVKQRYKKKPVFIINKDDGYGQRLIRRFEDQLDIVTYGMSVGSDFRATEVRSDFTGLRFQLEAIGRTLLVRLPLIGRYNVYNALAALAGAKALQLNLRESVKHLSEAPQVPGRLESIEHQGGFKVFIDYAHTPDALENVLNTLQALSPRRLICVFGCGGNRDREKRALMGQVAERFSDFSVLTSDNPRKEDPQAILKDIASGYRGSAYTIVEDRRDAIHEAIERAERHDIVVIAGKGHEATQQFADHAVPFDDRDEAYKALQVRDLMPVRPGRGVVA